MRVLVAGVLAAALTGGLTACGEDDPYADYCAEVKAQQKALTEAQAAGGATALIDALPSFRALQEESPRDIEDEWDLLVGRVEALVEALREDAIDLEAFKERAKESSRPFEKVLAELKRDGLFHALL